MKLNAWINLTAALVALVILALYFMNFITGEQAVFGFTVAVPYVLHLLNENRKRQRHRKTLDLKIPEEKQNENS